MSAVIESCGVQPCCTMCGRIRSSTTDAKSSISTYRNWKNGRGSNQSTDFCRRSFGCPPPLNGTAFEGRPRSPDLARPLRAEVRDALWMLARQWQVGKFQGEDAGVPVNAKLSAQLTAVSAIALGK